MYASDPDDNGFLARVLFHAGIVTQRAVGISIQVWTTSAASVTNVSATFTNDHSALLTTLISNDAALAGSYVSIRLPSSIMLEAGGVYVVTYAPQVGVPASPAYAPCEHRQMFRTPVFGLQLASKEVCRGPHRRRKWCRLPRGPPLVGFRDGGHVGSCDEHVGHWLRAPAGGCGRSREYAGPSPCSLTPWLCRARPLRSTPPALPCGWTRRRV